MEDEVYKAIDEFLTNLVDHNGKTNAPTSFAYGGAVFVEAENLIRRYELANIPYGHIRSVLSTITIAGFKCQKIGSKTYIESIKSKPLHPLVHVGHNMNHSKIDKSNFDSPNASTKTATQNNSKSNKDTFITWVAGIIGIIGVIWGILHAYHVTFTF